MLDLEARLNTLPPNIRDSLRGGLALDESDFRLDAEKTLLFLTSEDTDTLGKMAYAFSRQCADMVNKYRSKAPEFAAAMAKAPGYFTDGRGEKLKVILDFLRLFCCDDGTEARPLQPQSALAKLREDPAPYDRFHTHSYNRYCLLDMATMDFCSMQLGVLEGLREEAEAETKAIDPDYVPQPERAAFRQALTFNYDRFYEYLSNDVWQAQQAAKQLWDTAYESAPREAEPPRRQGMR